MPVLEFWSQISRTEKDIEIHLARAASELIKCYQGVFPEKNALDFQREVFGMVQQRDNPCVEDPSEIYMQFLPESERGKHFTEVVIAPLLNATAYFCRVLNFT